MDEQEKLKRIQEIRLIITEILMFLAIVSLVGFLTLVVSGYSFNLRGLSREDEELVERTGLVQISSLPTGATITLDGEAPLLLRTNGSRTLLRGEHEIVLTKDGFDTWTKTVEIREGMMYRVNYSRLFLTQRAQEEVLELTAKRSFVSPNKEKMLVVEAGATYLVDLNSAKPVKKLLMEEELTEVEWSGNSERILARTEKERAVYNVKVATEKFIVDEKYRDVKFESEAGERLLARTEKGELVELDIRVKENKPTVLQTGVIKFDNDGDRIVFLTTAKAEEEGEEKIEYQIRAMRTGAGESYLVRLVTNGEAEISTMRYFQETYFGVIDAGVFKVYRSMSWPEADWTVEKIFETEAGGALKLEKRGKGMVFNLLAEGGARRGFDIEAEKMFEFEAEGVKTGWVDEFLRYEIDEKGRLVVVDYDGLNRRELVEGDVEAGQAVTISGNSRYLYYFSEGKLVREKIN